MTLRFFDPVPQALDSSGNTIAGAKLTFYASGTSTLQDTFTTEGRDIANSNPVIADGAGRFPDIFLLDVSYKVTLSDASGAQIWEIDPYDGQVTSLWLGLGDTPTFVNATTFTVPNDRTADYTVGRLVRITDGSFLYGTITSSVFASSSTTIIMTLDSGAMTSGISLVEVSFVSTDVASVPAGGVSYLPPGSGAASRTVSNKLTEMLSVTDYMTAAEIADTQLSVPLLDHSAAIQAAFTYASANERGALSVYFPVGNYQVDTTIDAAPTTNEVPSVYGQGSRDTVILAGASLGANPIFSIVGPSPGSFGVWRDFRVKGTGYADGQTGIKSHNNTFWVFAGIVFEKLQKGIAFENGGAGFSEQNVLRDCWAINTLYFMYLSRATGSTFESFRHTGFESNCHMTYDPAILGARAIYCAFNPTGSLSCLQYVAPLNISVWTGTGDVLIHNEGATTNLYQGTLVFESGGSWTIESGSTAGSFVGILNGISVAPTAGTLALFTVLNHANSGFQGDNLYLTDSDKSHYMKIENTANLTAERVLSVQVDDKDTTLVLDKAYTCSWTSSGTAPAIGNGTLTATYTQEASIVSVHIEFVYGSTSTPGTGDWRFSIPLASGTGVGGSNVGTGTAEINDTGTGSMGGTCVVAGGLAYVIVRPYTTTPVSLAVSSAVPFTWANTDYMVMDFSYRV